MEWQDQAIVLSSRPHGESGSVVHLMTSQHGRHAGLVRGGQGRTARGLLMPGNLVVATWRARLAEHLGTLTCEMVAPFAARVLDDPQRLACLDSATALVDAALPEREVHGGCFAGLKALMEALAGDHWGEVYVQWEISLLAELGFALDLSRCAGGGNDQLAYVSPRTGCAVSLSAGEPYRDRLLPLPPFLIGRGGGGPDEILAGLRMTGHFLERHVFAAHHRPLPPARHRLAERMEAAGAMAP